MPMMGPYTATKAGVEALSDALRAETAPSGARVGCAYFGFIDTDLVRASYAQPSTEALNSGLPAFARNPAPLSSAVDAIERGIERRAARCVVAALGRSRDRDPRRPSAALERLAARDADQLDRGDAPGRPRRADGRDGPLLGVAAQAIDDPARR